MFLEDYNRYVGQYSPGVKSIVYRSTKLKLEKQAEIVLRWEKSPGNYDLHFTETGLLFESFHFENFRSEKIIYAYKGKPVQLININPETGFLNSTTKITYEKRKPIREVHNRGYSEEGINIRDYINYFYEGNSVRCEMRTTGENGWTKFTTRISFIAGFFNKRNSNSSHCLITFLFSFVFIFPSTFSWNKQSIRPISDSIRFWLLIPCFFKNLANRSLACSFILPKIVKSFQVGYLQLF